MMENNIIDIIFDIQECKEDFRVLEDAIGEYNRKHHATLRLVSFEPPLQRFVKGLGNEKLRSIGIEESIDEVYVLTGEADTIISFVRKKDLMVLKTMKIEDFFGGEGKKMNKPTDNRKTL